MFRSLFRQLDLLSIFNLDNTFYYILYNCKGDKKRFVNQTSELSSAAAASVWNTANMASCERFPVPESVDNNNNENLI